jgi:N-acetyl-gamma-glutamyl-phosphate reductase
VKQVAILGASGYTGREVQRLLRDHPGIRVAHAMTARADGPPQGPIAALDLERAAASDGVFVCAPHGAAAPLVEAVLESGGRVVDLSADFRLRDAALWERTYGEPHPAPALLEAAVYGLTEHRRAQVADARLVANPGCYPTSILLPLLPLLAQRLLDPQAAIVADAKSGVSGAGKAPSERTHFGNVHENFLAYAVGNHRHTPEIHQEAGTERILFVPHLLPVFRGILTTLYLRPAPGIGAARIRACLAAAYAGERFVRVYDRGLPELHAVQHTNRCDLAVAEVADHVVVLSAIDNLIKGAAGQAIQNMNLMLGLDEGAGLPA